MSRFEYPRLVLSDPEGKIFDHPRLKMAGRSGDRMDLPPPSELVPLPRGSQLFTMPGRIPIGWDEEEGIVCLVGEGEGWGEGDRLHCRGRLSSSGIYPFPASCHPSEARTIPSPALGIQFRGMEKGPILGDRITGRSQPSLESQDIFRMIVSWPKRSLDSLKKDSQNRLLGQLSRCALEYHCFAAKNVFFRRWECPLPTSPTCNAECIGCISLQPSECCPASQERIAFVPTVDEVLGVAVPHLEEAEDAIVSFGQGCEGEPLMQWRLLEKSIREMREKTDRGTINLNTNGSLPEKVKKLCDAGLDSIRVTLNSPHSRFLQTLPPTPRVHASRRLSSL